MPAISERGQKFMDELIAHADEGRSFSDAVAHVAQDVDGETDVKAMGLAIKQLEEKTVAEQSGKIKALETRLQKSERLAFNGSGQYRGAFSTEDHARAFGLLVIAKTQSAEWARDALKSEHKDLYDAAVKNKVFTSTTAAAVIPQVWISVMENLLEDHGVFERNALTIPMTAVTVTYSKKTGRVSAAPMSEGGAANSGQPSIEARELTARKWGAYTEINSEAEEDSIVALAEFVAADMAEAHALAVDEAGFLGDGTGTYNSITGVMNALNAGAILAAGTSAWGGYTLQDFAEVVGRCVTKTFGGLGMPKWYCSHAFFWQVMAPLQLAAGGNIVADIGRGPVMRFLGFDVEATQVLPSTAAASQKPLVFGNLRRGAAFGARRGLMVKSSEHFKFANDQTAMLSTRRFDIDVHATGDATNAETLVAMQTAA